MTTSYVGLQCHLCQSVTEADKQTLMKGVVVCSSCHAPLSVLNIVPEWDEADLTLSGECDSN